MPGYYNFKTGRLKKITDKLDPNHKKEIIGVKKKITFQFSGYSGWDMLYGVLPERTQASLIARRLLTSTYKDVDVESTIFVVKMPRASYEVARFDGKKVQLVQVASE